LQKDFLLLLFITDSNAEKLLTSAVQKTVVYKQPQDFIFARDTSAVESFNRVLLTTHSKENDASLSVENYKLRTNLAVL
jgi:hypothetical protein